MRTTTVSLSIVAVGLLIASALVLGQAKDQEKKKDDGTRPREARAAALAQWRHDLDALYGGRPAGQASFLQDAVRETKDPRRHFVV